MFCPSCGTEAPEGARFCGNCRHNLQPETKTSESSSGSDTMNSTGQDDVVVIKRNQSDDVSDGLKWGIIIASIFVGLIGIVMGLIYMNKEGASEQRQAVGKLWLIVGSVSLVLGIIMTSGGY